MAIYKETKDYKLIHDNMLNMGDYIADGTIDCIITDPPYELGFMGSGSTGKAVMFENRERNANYKFIGIELTDEYLPICEARIEYAINKYEYDEKLEQAKTSQLSIFDFEEEELK